MSKIIWKKIVGIATILTIIGFFLKWRDIKDFLITFLYLPHYHYLYIVIILFLCIMILFFWKRIKVLNPKGRITMGILVKDIEKCEKEVIHLAPIFHSENKQKGVDRFLTALKDKEDVDKLFLAGTTDRQKFANIWARKKAGIEVKVNQEIDKWNVRFQVVDEERIIVLLGKDQAEHSDMCYYFRSHEIGELLKKKFLELYIPGKSLDDFIIEKLEKDTDIDPKTFEISKDSRNHFLDFEGLSKDDFEEILNLYKAKVRKTEGGEYK